MENLELKIKKIDEIFDEFKGQVSGLAQRLIKNLPPPPSFKKMELVKIRGAELLGTKKPAKGREIYQIALQWWGLDLCPPHVGPLLLQFPLFEQQSFHSPSLIAVAMKPLFLWQEGGGDWRIFGVAPLRTPNGPPKPFLIGLWWREPTEWPDIGPTESLWGADEEWIFQIR